MYLCLPQTVESSRRDSSRALAEQFMTVAGVAPAGEESEHHLHHSQTDLQGFHNHFMSSYYRRDSGVDIEKWSSPPSYDTIVQVETPNDSAGQQDQRHGNTQADDGLPSYGE